MKLRNPATRDGATTTVASSVYREMLQRKAEEIHRRAARYGLPEAVEQKNAQSVVSSRATL